MNESQRNMYEESDFEHVYTGDITKIPEKGSLVAIDTASRGLVNMVTTGNYDFKKSPCEYYYDINSRRDKNSPEYRKTDMKGSFLISVEVRYPEDVKITNSRWLDELHPPLTIREKELIKNGKA